MTVFLWTKISARNVFYSGLQRAFKVYFILSGKCDMKWQSMNKEKKIGIVLIVFGICFPLMLLPFVSGYEKDRGMVQNLFNMGIMLNKEKVVTIGETYPSSLMRIIPRRLPYRFVLASGILFIFMGILKIDLSRRKDDDQSP
jgi:hypothetical protein